MDYVFTGNRLMVKILELARDYILPWIASADVKSKCLLRCERIRNDGKKRVCKQRADTIINSRSSIKTKSF